LPEGADYLLEEKDTATRKLRWYYYLLGLAVAGTLPACSDNKPAGPLSGTGVKLDAFDEEEKERDRVRSALVR
jgi:hypothetical protein